MNIKAVQRRYDWFSRIYDRFDPPTQQLAFQILRQHIIGSLHGVILEVGVGTGRNIPYYRPPAKVVGIDINPKILMQAKQKVSTFLGEDIELKLMDVENLALEDETFDIIVCTFVLCSVSNPIRATQEMLRVLKPDGRLILIEHVLSKMRLIILFQKLLNPFTRVIFGYNIDRDTVRNLKRGKSIIFKDQNLTKTDTLKFIVCKKPG